MINLLQPLIPEHGAFARGSLSKRPNLWNGVAAFWKPSLGVTGLTLRDVSGFNNHGALTNMDADDWVIGGNPKVPGYALDFNGSNDYIDFDPVPTQLQMGPGPFSISIWAQGDIFEIGGSRMFSVGTTVKRYEVLVSTSVVRFTIDDDITKTEVTWTTVTNTDWHHYFCCRDNSQGKLFLEVDGIPRANITNNTNNSLDENTKAAIGRLSEFAGSFWRGKIGLVLVHNRVLHPSERLDMFQHPNAMFEFADRFVGRLITGATNDADITLPQISLSAFSSPGIANIVLPILSVSSTSDSHGNVSLNLPPLSVLGIGTPGINSASITLPIFTIDALAKNHGDANLTFPLLTVSGTGVVGITSANITLPILTVLSSAISLHGDASLTLTVLTLSASDIAPATATITFPLLTVNSVSSSRGVADLNLPVLEVLSSAISTHSDSSLILPVLTVVSTSSIASNGDGSITFPIFTINGSSGLGGGIDLPLLTVMIRTYNGSAPDCVVMNTKNFAVTEYTNYGFNSMTKFNGANLIADQNGIYEEDGSDTDHAGIDDYPIKAHVKSGRIDLFKGSINKLRNAWVYYQSNGDIQMVTRSDKKETRYYDLPFLDTTAGINERRVKFQKGLRNRYVDFKMQNMSGSKMEIDKITITLEPVVSKRR